MAGVAFVILALCRVSTTFAAIVVNQNPPSQYTKWPTNIIPVRTIGMSNAYPEYNTFQAAMTQISLDLGYCVNFTVVAPTQPIINGQGLLIIQNRGTPTAAAPQGTAPNQCATFPGYAPAGATTGQIAFMFGSQTGSRTGGCLDTQRDAMRILVNALGLRNEYQRSDRASYMTFPTQVDRNSLVATTLQQYNLFDDVNILNATSATIASYPFDLNSITMVNGARFAAGSTPVFTTTTPVGQLARLSLQDCSALKQMYFCGQGYGPTPNCVDPYASTSGISLIPSPSVLTRSIQCATSASTATTTGTAFQIGAFQVVGLNCDQNSQATPTITPVITGLAARLTKYNGAQPYVVDVTNVLTTYTPGATPCNYVLEFTFTGVPAAGQLNQQLTVNIAQTVSGVSTNVAGLPVTLNLNCAPQFTSVSAFAVGPAPALASTQTRTLGGTAPNNNIQQVNNVNPNPTAGPAYTASTADLARPYMVQYYAVFGQTGIIRNAAAAAAVPTTAVVNKVFVNCLGTLVGAGQLPMVGTNVLGQLQATDPEGGVVSYYIWSELLGVTATPGERFDITPDGIITLSAVGRSPPVTPTVVGQVPPDNTAVTASSLSATGVAAADNLGDVTAIRNAVVTAVDSLGGKSTIEIGFFLTCGASA